MSRGSRRRQTKQTSPKSSRNSWIDKPGVRTYGIAAIVVAAVVTLVVFGLQHSASGDFEFTMYQGGDAVGGNEVNFDDLFPSDKPIVLNFWAGCALHAEPRCQDFNRYMNNTKENLFFSV